MKGLKNLKKIENLIASYLLKVIFGMCFAVTLIVTAIQLTAEYYHTKYNVLEEIKSFEDTLAPGMGTLLWTFSNVQLSTDWTECILFQNFLF